MERQALPVKQIVMIGGGLAGLSCAIRLAADGHHVRILEQQQTFGGKLQQVQHQGYRFDRGPSTITMLDAFEAVFSYTGRQMADYLSFYPIAPLTRNVFADGHRVDLTLKTAEIAEQIAVYSSNDAINLDKFMRESQRLYRLSREQFLNRLLLHKRDLFSPLLLWHFLRVKPMRSLQALLLKSFEHPNTLAMFGRYATYAGASPFQAPSIFAMMAQLEAGEGIYGVEGGTYAIVQAFEQLAQEVGVKLETGVRVTQLVIDQRRITGVETNLGVYPADVVVSGADALTTYRDLIPETERPHMNNHHIQRYEPSLSGYVQLIGMPNQYEQLRHHNVYFPEQYDQEFKSIFDHRQTAMDPTLYICWSGYSDSAAAPAGGSNLFVLVNAPALSDAWDWEQQEHVYREVILNKLEDIGLFDIRQADFVLPYTPKMIEHDTGAYQGSIYGISSNSVRQTFFRPGNKDRRIQGLWFVGGTTHPGGGTPIVTISGQLVAQAITKEIGS